MRKYKDKYMLGFETNGLTVFQNGQNSTGAEKKLIGFFNNQALHSPPLALSLMSNSLLRYFNIPHHLTLRNYPFEKTALDAVKNSQTSSNRWLLFGYSVKLS